jgi:hypothetical protein
MSEDSTRNEGEAATTSFEEWLHRQSEKQGVSEQELFERLVSSYWTLSEMLELLDGSKRNGGALDAELPVDAGSERRADESAADRTATDERSPGSREEVSERFEELDDRLEELRSDLDAESERGRSLDAAVEAMATQLTELETELDRERDARESQQQELADKQDRIRSWLDSEFDNLGTILKYLVTRTDDLKTEVSNVETRYEEALSRLRWERDALDSLKRDAADAGTRAGKCESCGSEIDLGLLARPYCPECENTLRGIEERTKWLFFSQYLVTTGTDGSATPDTGGYGTGAPPIGDDSGPSAQADLSGGGSTPSSEPEGTELADAIGSASPFEDERTEGSSTEHGSGSEPNTVAPETAGSEPKDEDLGFRGEPAPEASESPTPTNADGADDASTTDLPFDFGDMEEMATDESDSGEHGDGSA